jgi:site-specific recombinase XerD
MGYIPKDIYYSARRELERRRMSPRTVETYLNCIRKFLEFTNKSIDKISKAGALEFLSHLQERKYAGSSLNVYHMSIRFLMEDILRKNIKLNIKYSKRPERLPEVLTKEEVMKILDAIKNTKHKLMISLLYGAGLRVSELLNLKVRDINFENKYGFVRRGKGNKDRIFILPEKIVLNLQELIKFENLSNEGFLFLTNRREQYSPRTIAEIIKSACQINGIKRKIHPHTMRHSFATHLIQNGNSVSEVQSLLGHKSPETTMIYVHLASPKLIGIKSPLDNLS